VQLTGGTHATGGSARFWCGGNLEAQEVQEEEARQAPQVQAPLSPG
jgi:hypothetical protein